MIKRLGPNQIWDEINIISYEQQSMIYTVIIDLTKTGRKCKTKYMIQYVHGHFVQG